MQGIFIMSGRQDKRRAGGARGRVPHPSVSSGRQQSVYSSPVSGDASGLQKYTSSGGRVVFHGAGGRVVSHGRHIGPGNSSHTSSHNPPHSRHLQSISDYEDDDYDHELDNDDDDGDETPNDASQRDSTSGGRARVLSQKPPIERVGQGFGKFEVHQSIYAILSEHLKGPWITFTQVPKDILDKMYDKFKTRWSWDPDCNEFNREAFINMIKSRYRDIVFPPDLIAESVWEEMCDVRELGTRRSGT
ncbi:uncharacterized protein LOC143560134 [Bidens hawaiensis]|uniref:uncharacterized protein LOC143560134 n=1 Tax=Bidens hawaiensis TaxID=980011 RepID=UPI00404B6679